MDLETEIGQLRSQLATTKNEEARLRSEADTLVSNMRDSGVNPLADAEAFDKVDAAYLAADKLRDDIAATQTRIARALEITGERADDAKDSVERREARTFISRLTESQEFMRLREGRVLTSSASVQMNPVEIQTREEFMEGLRLRTTVDNTSGSGGGVIWSDRLQNLIVPMAQRRVRLLDMITVGTTDTDTVEYVRQTTNTDAAAGTAYGTALPESAYGWTKDSTTVKRAGHWVPATKGAIADSAQLETLLRSRLAPGHLRYLESQVWNGNGSGENLVGILDSSRSSVQTQARGSLSYHDVFHKAITKVRVANLYDDYEPTAFVITPQDYESLVLEKDLDNNYINHRGVSEISTLWGLTPVVTNLATSGTALVGDFSQAMLWVREGVAISMSDQHSDFFLKGLVAIKSEGRVAFDVMEEAAFVKVTGL